MRPFLHTFNLDFKQPEYLAHVCWTKGHETEVCLRRKSEQDKTFSLSLIGFCSFVRKFLALLITHKKVYFIARKISSPWKTV